MQLGVETIKNSKSWNNLFYSLAFGSRSPFSSRSYYALYAEVERAEVQCFIGLRDDDFIFYPYLIRRINDLGYDLPQAYYDVSGAYGYNGPIGIVEDEQFLHKYNTALQDHLRESNVVS